MTLNNIELYPFRKFPMDSRSVFAESGEQRHLADNGWFLVKKLKFMEIAIVTVVEATVRSNHPDSLAVAMKISVKIDTSYIANKAFCATSKNTLGFL